MGVLLLFVGVLLKTLQAQYDARLADREARLADKDNQIREIRADRDAWREVAVRGSSLSQRALSEAERAHQLAASPERTP